MKIAHFAAIGPQKDEHGMDSRNKEAKGRKKLSRTKEELYWGGRSSGRARERSSGETIAEEASNVY